MLRRNLLAVVLIGWTSQSVSTDMGAFVVSKGYIQDMLALRAVGVNSIVISLKPMDVGNGCDPANYDALTVSVARKAGMSPVDGYFRILPTCAQKIKLFDYVGQSVQYYKQYEQRLDRVWAFVTMRDQWSANVTENINTIKKVLTVASSHTVDIGICTDYRSWHTITANTNEFSKYPLCIDVSDENALLENSQNFGGWIGAAMRLSDVEFEKFSDNSTYVTALTWTS